MENNVGKKDTVGVVRDVDLTMTLSVGDDDNEDNYGTDGTD